MVIQTDYCLMNTRPQDDFITTLVGDDSFGRCVAICVERKGARDVLGVKALAAFARSLGQPRLVTHSDGEHSIVELVKQTCDELPRARQQVTLMASKGSKGKVEQANKMVEGMTTTIMSCVATRYEVEVRTGHPVVQWAILRQLERFQPGEDGLNGNCRQHRRHYQSTVLPFAEIVAWRDPGPHTLKLRSKWSYKVWLGRSVASDSRVIGTRVGCFMVRGVRSQVHETRSKSS